MSDGVAQGPGLAPAPHLPTSGAEIANGAGVVPTVDEGKGAATLRAAAPYEDWLLG